MPPRKGWAAVYCRLSKEDEEKTARESESIRNQRALLLAWAAEHGYRIYRVYADEDYSGIDRARPGFNAMLADARAGKFEVILAKTQSRFTRDMELVEKYLHGLFPEWGVRFIAVLDHVDTCDPAGKKARQINGLINEWYLEDLSGNVRAVLDHKRRSGSYIASFALYGYRKDPKDHSRLLPDEPAAQVVRQIFALYLQGNGVGRIAQTLNAQGVPPPSAYRAVSAGQPRPTPAPLWCKATVRRILSTQTYAGDLEQGRVRKLNYKSRRVIRLPREDWIIVPGTHVPLISRADFAAVQARLAAHDGQTAATRHPLAGLDGLVLNVVIHALQAAEFGDQRQCGFLADAGHAGDVVRRIAHQALDVDKLWRLDAVLLADGGRVHGDGLFVGRQQNRRCIVHKLQAVAVTGSQQRRAARGLARCGQRAENIVGLPARLADLHKAKVGQQLLQNRHLLGQLLGHAVAGGLVAVVGGVAERRRALIPRDGDGVGLVRRQQVEQYILEAVDGVGVAAILRRQQLDAEKRAVDQAVAVQDHEFHAQYSL